MRWVTGILLVLLVWLQYPLWLGPGNWRQVWHLREQLEQQNALDNRLAVRNEAMQAEVQDLKQGLAAVEERARMELGMVRKDEVYFQILEGPPVTTGGQEPVGQAK